MSKLWRIPVDEKKRTPCEQKTYELLQRFIDYACDVLERRGYVVIEQQTIATSNGTLKESLLAGQISLRNTLKTVTIRSLKTVEHCAAKFDLRKSQEKVGPSKSHFFSLRFLLIVEEAKRRGLCGTQGTHQVLFHILYFIS